MQPNDEDINALFYIVVVLSFYASALVLLMIKYMRGEQQDARLSYYYQEFVKRDDFKRRKSIFNTTSTRSSMQYVRCKEGKYADSHSNGETLV